MSRMYDSKTTTFSPEGRLHQVEYAMEAIGSAPTCMAVLATDGVVLAAERRLISKLLDTVTGSEKIYRLSDNMACGVSGITSDAAVLITYLRQFAQNHLYRYGESVPVELLVRSLCDVKQVFTQIGGKRPFGVSFLYIGWDSVNGFQLFQSDPSGNFNGWKATCIGSNSANATSIFKTDYKDDITVDAAIQLTIKALSKTLDVNKLTSDRVELCTLTRSEGKTKLKILADDDVTVLLDKFEAENKGQSSSDK